MPTTRPPDQAPLPGAGRDAGSRPAPLDLALAGLLAAGALALYVATLAPTVLPGDPGEFQFVPYLLGIAHPTGYPLYCLLGWAWSHLVPVSSPAGLAGGDVAYRLNLFSAVAAALAVGLAYPTAQALLRQALPAAAPAVRRLAAALAAAILAVTPTLWSQAIIAEVYGLHLLLVVAFLYLLLSWGASRAPARLLPAAACFGLGLAHHSTTLLLAPAALAYVALVVTSRPTEMPRLASGGGRRGRILATSSSILAALAPLLLYLYLPLRAPHTPYLHLPLAAGRELALYDDTLAGLVRFVSGGPFGGAIDLSVDFGARLAMAFGLLRDEVGWLGLGLALAGLVRLALERRLALLALTGLAYTAIAGFNLVYTIGDIYVLFVPSYLLVVLWLAVGVTTVADAVLAVAKRMFRRHAPAWGLLAVAPFFLLPLALGARNFAAVDQSGNTAAARAWDDILARPLPDGAVLVSDDRNDIMPLWYLQYVAGRRPDLLGLFPLITGDYPALGPVLDLALGTGRPVYLVKDMPGIEVKVRVEGERDTGLWRVIGPAAETEPAFAAGARVAEIITLAGYDRLPRSPRPGQDLEVRLYWVPLGPIAGPVHSYVHLVDGAGQVRAQGDGQPGGVFYPSPLWQPGERLVDAHRLALPADLPPGVYGLVAGLYTLGPDDAVQSVGEAVDLGPIAVGNR